MTAPDTPQPDRRGFFRDTLRQMIGPMADYLADKLPDQLLPNETVWLRPPGAIDEARFADVCKRCGACVEVCPADAIKPLQVLGDPNAGTPIIDADERACVVCEGLQCTHVCPSGALLPVATPAGIDMGIAVVDADVCVRTRGEGCTVCVDVCPLGRDAIRIVGPGIPEVLAGCVGCGVCQEACPTRPRAIVVQPARFRDA